MKIAFAASLYSTRMDREGETKLTLAIPSSELDKLISLRTLHEKLLEVTIECDDMVGY